jgi:hypothetical protein
MANEVYTTDIHDRWGPEQRQALICKKAFTKMARLIVTSYLSKKPDHTEINLLCSNISNKNVLKNGEKRIRHIPLTLYLRSSGQSMRPEAILIKKTAIYFAAVIQREQMITFICVCHLGTVNSQTIRFGDLYRSYFKGIKSDIELQV